MNTDHYRFLARLVHRRAGLVLDTGKQAMIERRLEPVMRRFGFKTLEAMMAELGHGHEALAAAATEAMTINETSFFRDPALFARLGNEILPALLAARAKEKRLRIWSAACSTGQEAYCLAIMLNNLGLAETGWSIDLIATDISAEAISRAERGYYTTYEAQRGLTEGDLAVWFQAEPGGYAVAPQLRRAVTFRRFNLLDSYGWLDDLDLVLCRNVLIYFDSETKLSVLERMAGAMAPGGVLALGETDTAQPLPGLFRALPGSGLYSRAPAPQLKLAI